jgi:hypothetical protein
LPKLYTVKALAELFDKHPNTIYRWFEEGLFPHAFKIKDGWYAPERDVEALIRQKYDITPPGLEQRPPVKRNRGFVNRWKS